MSILSQCERWLRFSLIATVFLFTVSIVYEYTGHPCEHCQTRHLGPERNYCSKCLNKIGKQFQPDSADSFSDEDLSSLSNQSNPPSDK